MEGAIHPVGGIISFATRLSPSQAFAEPGGADLGYTFLPPPVDEVDSSVVSSDE